MAAPSPLGDRLALQENAPLASPRLHGGGEATFLAGVVQELRADNERLHAELAAQRCVCAGCARA